MAYQARREILASQEHQESLAKKGSKVHLECQAGMVVQAALVSLVLQVLVDLMGSQVYQVHRERVVRRACQEHQVEMGAQAHRVRRA